ncbi:hypothetical protein R3P38DRAFT_3597672, partial [Favolaschia claudopus]
SISSLCQFLPTDTKATITGSLVRKITVDINGRRTTRQVLGGDAKMTPHPPGATGSADKISLDWDGEVHARADTMVGMFDAGCVWLQDFILLELKPLDVKVFSQLTIFDVLSSLLSTSPHPTLLVGNTTHSAPRQIELAQSLARLGITQLRHICPVQFVKRPKPGTIRRRCAVLLKLCLELALDFGHSQKLSECFLRSRHLSNGGQKSISQNGNGSAQPVIQWSCSARAREELPDGDEPSGYFPSRFPASVAHKYPQSSAWPVNLHFSLAPWLGSPSAMLSLHLASPLVSHYNLYLDLHSVIRNLSPN